jgi:hypothetical protein
LWLLVEVEVLVRLVAVEVEVRLVDLEQAHYL